MNALPFGLRRVPSTPVLASPPALRPYYVVITMADGSTGGHQGLYGHSMDAWNRAFDLFPDAIRIEVRSTRAVRSGPRHGLGRCAPAAQRGAAA